MGKIKNHIALTTDEISINADPAAADDDNDTHNDFDVSHEDDCKDDDN